MKVKCGDIIEIKTGKGFAYALYTHKHAQYGALLRVFDGIVASRPVDLGAILKQAIRFVTFFPLQAAVDKALVGVVGNIAVPEDMNVFPLFRTGIVDPRTKKVGTWWLWDGEREWQIGDITPDQRKLPIRGVVNDTLLVSRIEDSWLPENDPR